MTQAADATSVSGHGGRIKALLDCKTISRQAAQASLQEIRFIRAPKAMVESELRASQHVTSAILEIRRAQSEERQPISRVEGLREFIDRARRLLDTTL